MFVRSYDWFPPSPNDVRMMSNYYYYYYYYDNSDEDDDDEDEKEGNHQHIQFH